MKHFRIIGRIIVGGIFATIIWNIGIMYIFGPAQHILADPSFQSEKFISIFTEVKPLPKMVIQPTQYYVGFFIVGSSFSLVYFLMNDWIPGSTLKKGVRFGLVSWLLTFPWFEFYLPWNVMHEPILLVLLELLIWVVITQFVSHTIVRTHNLMKRYNL